MKNVNKLLLYVHLIIKMVVFNYNNVLNTNMNNVISIIWELLKILKEKYHQLESVFGIK